MDCNETIINFDEILIEYDVDQYSIVFDIPDTFYAPFDYSATTDTVDVSYVSFNNFDTIEDFNTPKTPRQHFQTLLVILAHPYLSNYIFNTTHSKVNGIDTSAIFLRVIKYSKKKMAEVIESLNTLREVDSEYLSINKIFISRIHKIPILPFELFIQSTIRKTSPPFPV